MFKIITFREPEAPVLFRPTQKIEVFDKSLAEFAAGMQETLLTNDGLGLAAPQVNKSIAFCIARIGKDAQSFCNPEIIWQSPEMEKVEEGCLSFPNVFLDISRSKEIEIVYQDLKGRSRKLKTSGLAARTLQHEIDHLNGIAFIERA